MPDNLDQIDFRAVAKAIDDAMAELDVVAETAYIVRNVIRRRIRRQVESTLNA